MAVFSGPEIVNANLRSSFDKSNIKSYSGSGLPWTDLIRNITYADPVTTGVGNESWMGSASTGITISIIIDKLATFVGYAEHPVNKWINTTDASFVLYHFGTTAGSLIDRIVWYANVGGIWRDVSARLVAVNETTYAITLQYNDSTGGQMWVNGAKIGGRVGSGARANSTNPLKIIGPVGSASSVVENFCMWDRELSDSEIIQNFEAIRSRYNV